MKNFFNNLKSKKNKWVYYLLFWIFFPLTIIALIVSFCFTPNQLANDRSSSYVNSFEFSINYANNSQDIKSYSKTQAEAETTANNLVRNFKSSLSSINIQPQVYENNGNYFYRINYIFSSASQESAMQAFLYAFSYYDNSDTLTLDQLVSTNYNQIVQYSDSTINTGSRTIYKYTTLAGYLPVDLSTYDSNNSLDNYQYEYTHSASMFNYSSAKIVDNDGSYSININLTSPINLNSSAASLIKNSKVQYLLWENKAAFVTLCSNLYSLYWLYENLYSNSGYSGNLQGLNSTQSIQYRNVINGFYKLFSSDSNYLTLAEYLYGIIGHEYNFKEATNTLSGALSNKINNYNGGLSDSLTALKNPINAINVQNIDNILFSYIPNSSSETLFSYLEKNDSKLLDSYIVGDITNSSSSYKKYFANITSTYQTSTVSIPVSVSSEYTKYEATAYLNSILDKYKYNSLNPILSPTNFVASSNTDPLYQNTYAYINTNVFGTLNGNNLELLSNSAKSLNLVSSTTTTTNSTNHINSDLFPNLTFTPNQNAQYNPVSTIYTTKYKFSNSITNITPWKAALLSIIIFVLIIGIIVSILYRFPGFIAWIISTSTLGMVGLVYQSLDLITTNATMFSYFISYLLTLFMFVIFLQKVDEIYRSGISYALAFARGLRYYISYSFDLYLIVFLSALPLVYFTSFEVQTIGIIVSIYFAISFLINYLFGLFILYMFSNMLDDYPLLSLTTKFSSRQNKNNYQEVNEFAFQNNPGDHYNFSEIESLLFTKNSLTTYLKPKKYIRWMLIIFTVISLFLILSFVISTIVILETRGFNNFESISASSNFNILGNYLFNQVEKIAIAPIGFSSFYILVRFGKGIIYFITGSISTYLLIALFLFSGIEKSTTNVESLALGLIIISFLNGYLNIIANHLFKFRKDINLKDAKNMLINVLYRQWKIHLYFFGLIAIFMIVNYIFNSTSLFVFSAIIFASYIITFIIGISIIPWLRLGYLWVKNHLFSNSNKKENVSLDELNEELIQGINEFSLSKKNQFVYE